jgi:predicted SpoU family rRNA methylase
VVVIGIKQPEKEIERGKVIYIKMVGKEIDKPGQVDESQMSLVIVMAMSKVGKEWEDLVDRNLVVVKTI